MQGARAAYQMAIDSGHPDQAPKASVNLGSLLRRHEDTEGARAAFQQAIDSGNPDYGPTAAFGLGILLEEQGDLEAAQAAYQQAIDSGHPDHAPRAAVNLGVLLSKQGELEGATVALLQALALYRRAQDRVGEAEAVRALLIIWIQTPTWDESEAFLSEHNRISLPLTAAQYSQHSP